MNDKNEFIEKLILKAWNFDKKNNFNKAELTFKKALKLNQHNANILFNFGTFYLKSKQITNSIKLLEKASQINPNIELIQLNLAIAYTENNNYDKAIQKYKNIIKINPNSIKAYLNLGNIYKNTLKYDDAIKVYKNALKIDSSNISIYNNLGIVFKIQKNFSMSIEMFEKALSINPKSVEILYNIGKLYKDINQTDDSKKYYLKALGLNPKNISIINNIGNLFIENLDYDEGINYFKKAIEIEPSDITSNSNFLINLCYLEKNNNNYLKSAKAFTKNLPILNNNKIVNFNSSENKKLNIGFVSADLRNHPVGFFLLDTLSNLKDKNLNTFAYYNNEKNDNLTKSFVDLFNNWKNVKKLNDIELINLIRRDKIDILFDLSGFTKNNRIAIFKNRCAPIQVAWCGWLASTGMEEIDFIVGDPFATPINDQNKFTEKIYNLKKIWCCLSTTNINKNIIQNNKNSKTNFGSFNSVYKINKKVIEIWAKILKQVDNSTIFLKHSSLNNKSINKIYNLFNNNGINNNKIIIEGGSKRLEFLSNYNKVDIALDTFPYNGGTTNFEASFMNVPILTMKNNSCMFRSGESINQNLDMQKWIASNELDYVNKAVEFANNKKYISEIKEYLKDTTTNSSLFNSKKFSENFYEMLVKIKK